ncbi:MAG TPA: hypothetical protein VKB00_06605 [Candidatus Limnocylindrales bacterium]|nr:hypothetical protein [Candidatus Limnocylindrales bacterium]
MTMRLALFLLCALLGLQVVAGDAQASLGIESFSTDSSNSEAGGHPDLSTSFRLVEPGVEEAARDVTFQAPEGIFGNPYAIAHCTSSDFALDQCQSDSQAGLITVYANHEGVTHKLLGTAPIFNVEPLGEQTALLAFIVPTLNIPINIPVAVRTAEDFGLRFTVQEITQITPLAGADLTLWGFPAIAAHDDERFPKGSPGEPSNCPGLTDSSCIASPTASNIPARPLTDNPTTCAGPLVTRLIVQTYQDPSNPTSVEGSYPATTDCDLEVFNPVLYASPTTTETDSASGLNLELSAPQFLGFANSPSELKAAIVTLPPGFTINPDAADGQTACSDVLANFDSESPARCPDSSKIGTFAIGTQALPGTLDGSVYIGEPKAGDQYRLFLIASGFGINAKLIGSVKPDPRTGQLTAYFEDLPQAPFDNFQLHLFTSDRGLMATPTHCTIYEVKARFFPWNGVLPDQNSSQVFGLDSGPHGALCPGETRPFHPRLVAGTSKPVAGAFSDFTLKLDRDDGDQFLGDLNFRLPPGFTGDLRGISYCPESSIVAAANNAGRVERVAPSCPASSQIGTTNVAAGPGSHPFHAVGKMYLSGPLKGAPLSLAAVTPALAGPYDYGVVVVRVALHIDPLTAQVFAASDTVPSIVGGIPIRMRSIQVNIDRPQFTINPTNCSSFTVDSQGIGDQGTVTDFSSYFQTVNCASLPFKPSMTVRQVGRRATSRSKNPRLDFHLRTRPGDANIRALSVTLSHAFEIDQRHLGNICSERELAEKQCAGRTPIGRATTETPLLDQPLSGPAYAVSGTGGLPRLAFILNGQVNLVPRADTVTTGGGQLKTTVPVVPDAPIGHFSLTVFGGKTGYLINTRDICAHRPVTRIAYTAQNGKTRTQSVKVKAACGKKSKQSKHRRRARAR